MFDIEVVPSSTAIPNDAKICIIAQTLRQFFTDFGEVIKCRVSYYHPDGPSVTISDVTEGRWNKAWSLIHIIPNNWGEIAEHFEFEGDPRVNSFAAIILELDPQLVNAMVRYDSYNEPLGYHTLHLNGNILKGNTNEIRETNQETEQS